MIQRLASPLSLARAHGSTISTLSWQVFGGLAVLENAHHETVALVGVPVDLADPASFFEAEVGLLNHPAHASPPASVVLMG